MAKNKNKSKNRQGFIDAYNAKQHSGAYGTPQYWAAYDPSQPFGTAQNAGTPPPDWQQIAYEQQNQRNVALSDAQATYERGNLQRDYGFDAAGNIDASNPYGRAAELQRSYQQGQRGDNTGFAAQGQLYSGAYQNQIENRTHGYNSASNAMKNAYQSQVGQTYLNQAQTYANAGSAVSQSQIEALIRQLTGGK